MNPRLIRRPGWKEIRRFQALELKNERCAHEEIAEALGAPKDAVTRRLCLPPAGVDLNSAESLSNAMRLFEPRHIIMPFLAHAVGTLAGALDTYMIAANYKAQIAYTIGAVFLCGGVAASLMIPAPTWFIALDLLAAYLPMA